MDKKINLTERELIDLYYAGGLQYIYLLGYDAGFELGLDSNNSFIQGLERGKDSTAHSKPVEQLKDGNVIDTHPSTKKAADAVGGIKQGVSRAIKNKTKYKDYEWRFKK